MLSLVVLGFVLSSPARSQSLWNQEGLGGWQEGYDLASRGAGGTGIGVADSFAIGPVNPALIAWTALPTGQVAYLTEQLWIRAREAESSDHLSSGKLPGIRVVVPGPGPLSWALGYRDLSDGTYRFERLYAEGREDAFRRKATGSGGLGEFSGTVAARLARNRIGLGLMIGVAQGTLKEVIEDDFVSGAYIDTRNLLRTRLEGGHPWSVGVSLRPTGRVGLGATYQGESQLDLESLLRTTSQSEVRQTATIDLPAALGLGLAWRLDGRTRLSADWIRRSWSKADFRLGSGGTPSGGFNGLPDTDRFGVGVTRLPGRRAPKDALLSRSVWRAGFALAELPIHQQDGSKVSEWLATGGLGLPIQFDRGSIDLLIEVGRRGDLSEIGLRETFARFGVGITFGRLRSAF